KIQSGEERGDLLGGYAEVNPGGEEHVAGDSADRLEVENSSHVISCASRVRSGRHKTRRRSRCRCSPWRRWARKSSASQAAPRARRSWRHSRSTSAPPPLESRPG